MAAERPILQVLANYKYDEYQQFTPGMRFVESLAQWLAQFATSAERKLAYSFFKSRLIFCSTAEMNHLVAIAYLDHIRPRLLARSAQEAGLNRWLLGKVASSVDFRRLQRQTLFLGLSDGARTDTFRRANADLSHEQIRQSHELAEERIEKLLEELGDDLKKIGSISPEPQRFRFIVLLDDFSASGISYFRPRNDGQFDGKVGTFLRALFHQSKNAAELVSSGDLEILVVLYMATEAAERYIRQNLSAVCTAHGAKSDVIVVYPLTDEVKIMKGQAPNLDALIDRYYDDANETKSTRLGGTDLRYGFAACGLPLILSHNTPNNSVGLPPAVQCQRAYVVSRSSHTAAG